MIKSPVSSSEFIPPASRSMSGGEVSPKADPSVAKKAVILKVLHSA